MLRIQHRSTKAGASTPATLPNRLQHRLSAFAAQRRPERQLRRHPKPCRAGGARSRSLNEGRSVNSGDTRQLRVQRERLMDRSTKAGASTPATLGLLVGRCRVPDSLNEGRSVNSGDTLRRALNEVRLRARSTKAGASTPATPANTPIYVCKSIWRSTKAGASTPATRDARPRPGRGARALNEGRSVNSGDTPGSSPTR